MKLKIFYLVFSTLITGLLKAQNPITITPSDAMVEMATGYPTCASTNYGTYSLFLACDWSASGELWIKSFMKVDLSQIPSGATINQVKLYLYSDGTHANTSLNGSSYKSNACYLLRTTQDWAVNTITWNNQPLAPIVNAVTLSNSTTANQDYVVDITQLVKDMISNPTQGNGLVL